MKYTFTLLAAVCCIVSCSVSRPMAMNSYAANDDTLITQSLFNDRSSTISEENIQKILTGNYQLPQQLRVAIVALQSTQTNKSYRYYRNDEEYLKTQQSYLDSFTRQLSRSPRVGKVSIIPDLLISKSPSFTNIREVAVRIQADVVIIYSIAGDIYSKYKVFAKPDIKAFATTQLVLLDVRTGLVPFSTIVTRDYLAQKKKGDMDIFEAENNTQKEAVLLTINEIGNKLTDFLKTP